jgi:hypothetical protein
MKKRHIYAITPDRMAAINAKQEARIAEYARQHGLSTSESRKALISIAARMSPRQKKTSASAKSNEKKRTPKLKLISKRGTRVEGRRNCSKCGSQFTATWRYAESTQGTVYLCMGCAGRVKRIGGRKGGRKLDALDLAYSGGRFEGNRRKH